MLGVPLCGSLEDEAAIAQIGRLLLNEENGLKTWCVNDAERWLCRHYQQRLTGYPDTTREEWARLKELCLLHHGSPIAAAIDTMASAHRTNAIAEAAIRASGDKLYQADTVYQINVNNAEEVADILEVISRKLREDKKKEEEF